MLRGTLFAGGSGIMMSAGLATAYVAVYLVIVVGVLQLRMPLGVLLLLVRDALPARLARAGGYKNVWVMAGAMCTHD